jgi:hypothetical protein
MINVMATGLEPPSLGMVYVAFVIDDFACRIADRKVSTSMSTSFVLDAVN